MYTNDYLIKKLTEAVYDLVSGVGDARDRVGQAYYRFWTIKPEDFPSHLREERIKIDSLLTRLPAREGYIIPENLSRMKNKTASKIAVLIFELYLGMIAHQSVNVANEGSN